MKPPTQISTLLRRLCLSPNLNTEYVCRQCRCRALKTSRQVKRPVDLRFYSTRNRDSSDDENSFTERLRRKLWRQDADDESKEPEASNDVVSGDEEQTHSKPGLAEAPIVGSSSPGVGGLEYQPAATWDGLEQIGGATGWWEEEWDQEHSFEGYVPYGIM